MTILPPLFWLIIPQNPRHVKVDMSTFSRAKSCTHGGCSGGETTALAERAARGLGGQGLAGVLRAARLDARLRGPYLHRETGNRVLHEYQ